MRIKLFHLDKSSQIFILLLFGVICTEESFRLRPFNYSYVMYFKVKLKKRRVGFYLARFDWIVKRRSDIGQYCFSCQFGYISRKVLWNMFYEKH